MIFAIIDLLEKLLAWFKPFARKEEIRQDTDLLSKGRQSEAEKREPTCAAAPPTCDREPSKSTDNVLTGIMDLNPNLSRRSDFFSTSADDQEVLADLAKWKAAASKNPEDFAWGMIFERGSDRAIMRKRERAALSVWYSLDMKWRGKYTFLWATE